MARMALLYDMVQCSGCRQCVEACMQKQGFDGDPEQVTQLSSTAYTAMIEENDYPVRLMCRHCETPSCASVCPVKALRKTELGPVTYDSSVCIVSLGKTWIRTCPSSVIMRLRRPLGRSRIPTPSVASDL